MELTGKDQKGNSKTISLNTQGNLLVNPASAKYQETVLKGNVYSLSISNQALIAGNAIITAVDATAKPIVAIYNPPNSGKNLVILQGIVSVTKLSDTAVAPGGFMWVGSGGNSAITTATNSGGVNLLTLRAAGSVGGVFTGGVALTGLSNSLINIRPVSVPVPNAAGAATAASIVQGTVTDSVEGAIIVPPGGVVGIMNAVSTTTVYVSASIVWSEIDI